MSETTVTAERIAFLTKYAHDLDLGVGCDHAPMGEWCAECRDGIVLSIRGVVLALDAASVDVGELKERLQLMRVRHNSRAEAAEAARDAAIAEAARLREALTAIRKKAHHVAVNGGWGDRCAEHLGVDVRELADAALHPPAADPSTPKEPR